MMIVQCPQCQAKYFFDEKQFIGRAQVQQQRCPKCQTVLTVRAPATTEAAAPSGTAPTMAEASLPTKISRGVQLPEGKAVALSVTQGPLKGKIFPVTKPRVVLGRSGTDIVVDDSEVSRTHCAIEVRGLSVFLMDLGSSNGTFVDNQKIETYELEHLSEFRIGATTLMLIITNE